MANKKPKTIAEQLQLLKDRGMLFRDEKEAPHFLSHISYYRLKGYWWDMQSDYVNHKFKPNSYFEDVIERYNFDRHLRLIIFNAIERIEIALRTKMIYHLSLKYGPLWFQNNSIFNNANWHQKHLSVINKEITHSKEVFIVEHKKNHPSDTPEAWKTLEILSLGILSKLYKNLNHQLPEKSRIANEFGLNLHNELSAWIEAITYIRNIIAHHSRLWNKKLVKTGKWPKKTKFPFLTVPPQYQKRMKLYYMLSAILYLINIISPDHTLKKQLFDLFNKYPNIPLYKIGFPDNWKNEPLWK